MLQSASTLTAASREWATRGPDERFDNLFSMRDKLAEIRSHSKGFVVSNRQFECRPAADDGDLGLEVVSRNGNAYNPTHYAFGQLAALADAPAGYLRKLAAPLAADCINYGLIKRPVEDIGLLLRKNGKSELAAATGPKYGRVWNIEIAEALCRNFGNGIDGDWRAPGEFGERVAITKDNTTFFAGDRDMFVFLADEVNRIEIGGRRSSITGKSSLARGFFVWNSEVGSQTLGVAAFLFDYACSNRIVWGARDYREIKFRHTAGAPDRFLEQVLPVLDNYRHGPALPVEQTIRLAQQAKLDTTVADFLKNRRYGQQTIARIQQAHDIEEGRPMETLWDVVTGVTAYAKTISHQDDRVDVERDAGKILDLVAVK